MKVVWLGLSSDCIRKSVILARDMKHKKSMNLSFHMKVN